MNTKAYFGKFGGQFEQRPWCSR